MAARKLHGAAVERVLWELGPIKANATQDEKDGLVWALEP